jgi:hypothetical protein
MSSRDVPAGLTSTAARLPACPLAGFLVFQRRVGEAAGKRATFRGPDMFIVETDGFWIVWNMLPQLVAGAAPAARAAGNNFDRPDGLSARE